MRKHFVVAAVIVGAVALGAAPGFASKASDQKAATAAVLQPDAVPAGFTGEVVEGDVEVSETPPECGPAIMKADQSVLRAPLARSVYGLTSTTGGFGRIENTVAVLPSTGQAKKAMAAYAADEATSEACFEALFQSFFAAPSTTVDVTIGSFSPELDDKGNKKVIKGGDEFLGYGGSVRRSAGGAPQFFEPRVILARDGRAVTQLVLIASGTIPQDDAQAMLQSVIDGMAKV